MPNTPLLSTLTLRSMRKSRGAGGGVGGRGDGRGRGGGAKRRTPTKTKGSIRVIVAQVNPVNNGIMVRGIEKRPFHAYREYIFGIPAYRLQQMGTFQPPSIQHSPNDYSKPMLLTTLLDIRPTILPDGTYNVGDNVRIADRQYTVSDINFLCQYAGYRL